MDKELALGRLFLRELNREQFTLSRTSSRRRKGDMQMSEYVVELKNATKRFPGRSGSEKHAAFRQAGRDPRPDR